MNGGSGVLEGRYYTVNIFELIVIQWFAREDGKEVNRMRGNSRNRGDQNVKEFAFDVVGFESRNSGDAG